MDWDIDHFFTDTRTFWYLVFINKIRFLFNSIFQDFRRPDVLDAKKRPFRNFEFWYILAQEPQKLGSCLFPNKRQLI